MRRPWRAALAALAALIALAGCDDDGVGALFRNLGKRGDSPVRDARPDR